MKLVLSTVPTPVILSGRQECLKEFQFQPKPNRTHRDLYPKVQESISFSVEKVLTTILTLQNFTGQLTINPDIVVVVPP